MRKASGIVPLRNSSLTARVARQLGSPICGIVASQVHTCPSNLTSLDVLNTGTLRAEPVSVCSDPIP